MVRKRERKTNIGLISEEEMRAAVRCVMKENQPIREVSRIHSIPKSTLQRYVDRCKTMNLDWDANPDGQGVSFKPNYSVRKIFSTEQEQLLVEYLQHAAKLHHGLPYKEARKLAYQYAVKLNKNIPDSWKQNEEAGLDWLLAFIKRGDKISLRKPEATSINRAMAFNKPIVMAYFDQLRNLYEKYKFSPQNIYNLDETGLTTVQDPKKVIATKGAKQVGQITSAERGELVTLCGIINAVGNAIPPFFIFPRVVFKETMLIGAPPGSTGTATSTGWMNNKIFLLVLDHLIKFVKPSKDTPILLIMDNHESHVSVEAIQLAKDNGIVLFTIPPHCSHKIQPLDKGVYGPLKRFYSESCRNWLVNHPGQRINIHHIAFLLGQSYAQAFSISNITSGFKSTGIYPFNNLVYKDEDFVAADVTDIAITTPSAEPDSDPKVPSTSSAMPSTSSALPSTSSAMPSTSSALPSTSQSVTPEMIRPHPKAERLPVQKKGKAKKKSEVLTDTPVKERIERELAEREEKKIMKEKRKTEREMKAEGRKKSNVIKKLKLEESSSEDDDVWQESESDDVLQMEELSEEDNPNIDVGDFVLVKVCGKKSFNYYAAEIVEKSDYDNYGVKYLKRVMPSFKFVKGEEETYFALESDVELKLPPPITHGGTGRTIKQLSFNVDLTSFSSQLR